MTLLSISKFPSDPASCSEPDPVPVEDAASAEAVAVPVWVDMRAARRDWLLVAATLVAPVLADDEAELELEATDEEDELELEDGTTEELLGATDELGAGVEEVVGGAAEVVGGWVDKRVSIDATGLTIQEKDLQSKWW
jgi:hypothetical protein